MNDENRSENMERGTESLPRYERGAATKGTKRILLFAVLFCVLYLITNNLSDSQVTYEKTAKTNEPLAYDLTALYMPELVALLEDYPEIAEITDNIEDYPEKLLRLVLLNQETIEFVLNYHDAMISVTVSAANISDEITEGTIPHFIQWDARWGYSFYGGEVMGIDGCGPTTLAMVAAGLTGNAVFTPRYVAEFSAFRGYITKDNSTSWTLMSEGAKEFGLVPKELPLDANVITSALKRGEPVICSMGPGDFTTSGHFIVLIGVTADGKILLNDSFSRANTAKEWDLTVLMSQMKNLWSFKKM